MFSSDMEKVLFAWSSGKDCALAFHTLKQQGNCSIVSLLTTVTEEYNRVSMHGVRKELLEQQAASLGLDLELVWIPKVSTNSDFEQRMESTLIKFKRQGVTSVAFGDIFLEDLRKYREENLAKIGMKAIFPLWKRNTRDLAKVFMQSGFKATITCVDTAVLDGKFSGRNFDPDFLSELPVSVDPCGENGEFHSFAYDGPVFNKPISFTKGEIVLRDNRFNFCDLLPC